MATTTIKTGLAGPKFLLMNLSGDVFAPIKMQSPR
jgi:hypothetical protein